MGQHTFPRPEKKFVENYHNWVGVLSSSTYKTDLLADKQKKKGGVKEGDCDTFFPDLKKKLWQNYHNGSGVLSSSMYMTGI